MFGFMPAGILMGMPADHAPDNPCCKQHGFRLAQLYELFKGDRYQGKDKDRQTEIAHPVGAHTVATGRHGIRQSQTGESAEKGYRNCQSLHVCFWTTIY
ncbi:hypothetical protein CODIS_00020 [Candidatus Thiodiazotropha endolucinida]|uniref:Uncharacterized protein n=1 Tax=Candidatus Thiodiazotropha endolucinida TaxID=1655433 RepID=A0A7Z0VPL3_9GAMM|nr:hypothetical protein CODIS_00020 [Candidatus Thiodiazotropha endolucinida]